MTCPECGCTIMYCESVLQYREDSILRLRVCAECGYRVVTKESVASPEEISIFAEEKNGMHN